MRLNHHRRGRGEPLLLLHPIGSHWRIWSPVLGHLAREREVVAVDMPGFGESLTLRDAAPTVSRLARAVADFCTDELGWEHPHVAGNSTGGGVALELARAGFARSVCAISPIGFHNTPELAYLRAVLRSSRALTRLLAPRADRAMASPLARTALLGVYFARPWRIPAEDAASAVRAYAYAPGFEATLEAAIGWEWPGGPDPEPPVTIVWGTRDLTLPVTQARRAERALAHVRHVRLPRLGHAPMSDDPDAVARVILEASSA